jgi:osmoprotectant transport system permease protein
VKCWFLLCLLPGLCCAQQINVGSKRFTESYVLGEIMVQSLRQAGEAQVGHQQGLGNTAIVFAALKSGAVDLYPDYTGTIAFELLGLGRSLSLEELNRALAAHGLGAAISFGFNNTYALGMSEPRANARGVSRISDLRRHPDLKVGLSQEFLSRKDGWPVVRTRYTLPHDPRGFDHGLAYEALAAGTLDVIDVYSTDAKISRYSVRVLEDDLRVFPAYDAVVLYRLDFPERFPRSWAALKALEGSIDTTRMAALNAQVELQRETFSAVASDFLRSRSAAGASGASAAQAGRTFVSVLFGPDFTRLTLQHVALVVGALAPAVALGIPLGIWAARSRRAAGVIMATVGLMQTLPALALLAFLITLIGSIGTVPAIIALFLYSLLPIVRNTASGLEDLPPSLRDSARSLGLPRLARLRRIELPLASRSIFAGAKTAAVTSVGTATIAAFIGAGGYGERIVSGLAVNDSLMLLAGAVPAAALALAVQWLFDIAERRLVPAGLQLPSEEASRTA